MAKKETYNEMLLLKCAEEEFLEKGYTNTKTTEIAKRAGVTHAMLHYYYRTKENLFERVLQNKLEDMVGMFSLTLKQDLPFPEKLKQAIEEHFDYIAANPQFPSFIFNEILPNESAKEQFIELIKPRAKELIENLSKGIQEELRKGTIKDVKPFDLLYTIISLNIFSFVAMPVFEGVLELAPAEYTTFMEHRKNKNVEIVLASIRSDVSG